MSKVTVIIPASTRNKMRERQSNYKKYSSNRNPYRFVPLLDDDQIETEEDKTFITHLIQEVQAWQENKGKVFKGL